MRAYQYRLTTFLSIVIEFCVYFCDDPLESECKSIVEFGDRFTADRWDDMWFVWLRFSGEEGREVGSKFFLRGRGGMCEVCCAAEPFSIMWTYFVSNSHSCVSPKDIFGDKKRSSPTPTHSQP